MMNRRRTLHTSQGNRPILVKRPIPDSKTKYLRDHKAKKDVAFNDVDGKVLFQSKGKLAVQGETGFATPNGSNHTLLDNYDQLGSVDSSCGVLCEVGDEIGEYEVRSEMGYDVHVGDECCVETL